MPGCHALQFRLEVIANLRFGHTTDAAVFLKHGNILQLIQVTENTDLAELGNTSDENKAQIFVITFQSTKEALEDSLVVLLQRVIFKCLQ